MRTVSLGCDIGSVRHDSGGSSDLSAVVPAVGADLGVLHDADGSRAIFVDSDGVCIAGDEIGALVARTMISEGSEVVTPFTSSRTLSLERMRSITAIFSSLGQSRTSLTFV